MSELLAFVWGLSRAQVPARLPRDSAAIHALRADAVRRAPAVDMTCRPWRLLKKKRLEKTKRRKAQHMGIFCSSNIQAPGRLVVRRRRAPAQTQVRAAPSSQRLAVQQGAFAAGADEGRAAIAGEVEAELRARLQEALLCCCVGGEADFRPPFLLPWPTGCSQVRSHRSDSMTRGVVDLRR